MKTAKEAGLLQCGDCHKLLLFRPNRAGMKWCCPRCGSTLHQRIPNSLSHCWAYLITSIILFFPANLLPIMTFSKFGNGHADTIMSGVITLIKEGMVPLGVIVFVASILVPLLKIIGLIFLLLSIQFRWNVSPHRRTILYRIIEFVGRWSMLDIFVITILVAIVDLGAIAQVIPGMGATAFGAVVMLTMLAARKFDSRLIWDNHND
jgi:paraquat-inducible protein A